MHSPVDMVMAVDRFPGMFVSFSNEQLYDNDMCNIFINSETKLFTGLKRSKNAAVRAQAVVGFNALGTP